MSVTVVLSLAGTIVAAAIAAGVALYIKRIERWNSAELRHSEAREKAYETYLAACDRAWHLRAKQAIDRHYHPDQALSDARFKEIGGAAVQQASAALEEVQRHASNFERAAPVLVRLYHLAFEQNPPDTDGFEQARLSMLELQRADEGLRKKMSQSQKASPLARVKQRREVRRIMANVTTMIAVYGPEEDEVIIHQDHGSGEGIMYLMRQIMDEWEDLQRAVAMQEDRSRRWKGKGLWPE